MHHPTQQELVETIIISLDLLERDDPSTNHLFSYLYQPHPLFAKLLLDLQSYTKKEQPSKQEREDAGRLMEQIAGAAFSRLKGVSSLKSYQSAAAQYDLLVSGDTASWLVLTKKLYMQDDRRDILIEAKARKDKLTDREFSRLIGILETHLTIVGLGVFFTLRGATGFPKPGTSQRSLRDCQLRQALYYAKTEKAIIIFDIQDIASLNEPGALPRLIARKVRDLSELSGSAPNTSPSPTEVNLPPHISSIWSGNT